MRGWGDSGGVCLWFCGVGCSVCGSPCLSILPQDKEAASSGTPNELPKEHTCAVQYAHYVHFSKWELILIWVRISWSSVKSPFEIKVLNPKIPFLFFSRALKHCLLQSPSLRLSQVIQTGESLWADSRADGRWCNASHSLTPLFISPSFSLSPDPLLTYWRQSVPLKRFTLMPDDFVSSSFSLRYFAIFESRTCATACFLLYSWCLLFKDVLVWTLHDA